MNNNPNKVSSDKKAVLNFNADVWKVDMPIARRVVNTVQNPMMNSVPGFQGGNYNTYTPSQNSIPGVNSTYSMPSVSTVPDKNEKKKSSAGKIILIIIITLIVVAGLLVYGYEEGVLSVTSDNVLTEIANQFSDEAIQNFMFT